MSSQGRAYEAGATGDQDAHAGFHGFLARVAMFEKIGNGAYACEDVCPVRRPIAPIKLDMIETSGNLPDLKCNALNRKRPAAMRAFFYMVPAPGVEPGTY